MNTSDKLSRSEQDTIEKIAVICGLSQTTVRQVCKGMVMTYLFEMLSNNRKFDLPYLVSLEVPQPAGRKSAKKAVCKVEIADFFRNVLEQAQRGEGTKIEDMLITHIESQSRKLLAIRKK